MGNAAPQCCSDPVRGKAKQQGKSDMLPAKRSMSTSSLGRPDIEPITPREERGKKKLKDPEDSSHSTCGPNKERTTLFLACGHS